MNRSRISRFQTANTHQAAQVATATICVVDARPADYASWLTAAQRWGVQISFVGSGREALRMARTQPSQLWVVNSNLPDMAGADLCAMLKRQCPESVLYAIADEYSVQDELAAIRGGAALFGCKPSHHDWLEHWAESVMQPSESILPMPYTIPAETYQGS